MSRWRALWRGLRVLAHLLHGWWTLRRLLARQAPPPMTPLVREWSRRLLCLMGVELVVHGQPPTCGPLLLVANHVSWLDIIALNAVQPLRFVSKADVKRWPLLGTLCAGTGTLYIERASRHDALRVVHLMAERLQAGDLLAVFPEGTTGDGTALLPFHANLLQAAIAAQAPALPVGLTYVERRSGARSTAPLYTGDTALLTSIWRTLCASELQAVLHFGQAQCASGRERRAWAQELRSEVERLLQTG